jgi:hypothetical protein
MTRAGEACVKINRAAVVSGSGPTLDGVSAKLGVAKAEFGH